MIIAQLLGKQEDTYSCDFVPWVLLHRRTKPLIWLSQHTQPKWVTFFSFDGLVLWALVVSQVSLFYFLILHEFIYVLSIWIDFVPNELISYRELVEKIYLMRNTWLDSPWFYQFKRKHWSQYSGQMGEINQQFWTKREAAADPKENYNKFGKITKIIIFFPHFYLLP